MADECVLIAKFDGVLRLTLNRPDKLNALNRDTLTELNAAFEAARADSTIRVVIVTGAGSKAFIAGADISELAKLTSVEALEFSRAGQALMTRIERLGKPVIAAVNGFALGGGMELAMACHFRLASTMSKWGQPEINLGIIPGFGGTQRLVRLAGRGCALDLCLTGRTIDAERALALGIVHSVHAPEDLHAAVDALAAQLAASAPHALRGILDATLIGSEASLDVGLDYESTA
ncbi:MAG: enoyl-CoA hydratase-related protein, partial [Lysobacterales bacterium]